jgi:hypothetical protein
MGSKTARREAPNVKSLLGKAATFGGKLIKTQRFNWHGPTCNPCSTPFDIPPIPEIQEQVDLFLNPPTQTVEPADVSTKRDR